MNLEVQSHTTNTSRGRLKVAREYKDEPLRECVRNALTLYLKQLDGHGTNDMYRMVMNEVEPPMLQTVLKHCGGNQTRAAQMLGMSRSTLRKKLGEYGLNL
jgi:Fis family transcriptional regulator